MLCPTPVHFDCNKDVNYMMQLFAIWKHKVFEHCIWDQPRKMLKSPWSTPMQLFLLKINYYYDKKLPIEFDLPTFDCWRVMRWQMLWSRCANTLHWCQAPVLPRRLGLRRRLRSYCETYCEVRLLGEDQQGLFDALWEGRQTSRWWQRLRKFRTTLTALFTRNSSALWRSRLSLSQRQNRTNHQLIRWTISTTLYGHLLSIPKTFSIQHEFLWWKSINGRLFSTSIISHP